MRGNGALKTTALIMAGGRGERFWPYSRLHRPKQFLCLMDNSKTMIQNTVERIRPLVASEDIFVATNSAYFDMVRQQLPDIPEQNILLEPVGRDTAPCIGLGAVHIRKKYGDAVMMVLPSDHIVHQAALFRDTLVRAASEAVQQDALVTLGIPPFSPNTAYGYLKYDVNSVRNGVYRVASFKEKPDLETAKRYLLNGNYLWNSGMFIWRVSEILKQMQEFLPENYALLTEIEAAIGKPEQDKVLLNSFTRMQTISVDFGIMERAKHVLVIPASFGWDDVGSWLALERVKAPDARGNVVRGDVICVNSTHNIISGSSKLIAMVGVDNMIVVDTDDALLLCDKDHTASIKQVLDTLRSQKRSDLL